MQLDGPPLNVDLTHFIEIHCTIITYSIYKNMWKVQKYIMSALCGSLLRWSVMRLLILWLLEPLIHGLEFLSPHILVSYCQQTMHQSVDTRDLSWSAISACSYHHDHSQTDAPSCVIHCHLWNISFDTCLLTALFSRPHSCLSLRALVAILITQHFYFFTRGDNLIIASTRASLVQP